METELHEINVTLLKYQKEDIFHAFINRKKILLLLKNDALTGNDTLLVPKKSLKWDIEHCMLDEETFPDEETYPESFKWDIEHNAIYEKTFSEMLDNGFKLVPSMNDEGVKNFRVYIPPTVNESLEKARKKNKEWEYFLDYSLLTESTEYSVFKNIGKLMENIPSLGIYEKY